MTAQPVVPQFPLNPFVGQVWLNWIWNGSIWVCQGQGPIMAIRAFTATAMYMPSPGTSFAIVECLGAGGGGGGAQGLFAGASAAYIVGGGGGGSGGYSRSVIPLGVLQGGVQVTVGAGGAGGGPKLLGGLGGDTTFGSLVLAQGGFGGAGADGNLLWGSAGSGGDIGDGDLAAPGNPGGSGFPVVAQTGSIITPPTLGGQGGAGFFGGASFGSEAAPLNAMNGSVGWLGSGGGGGASGGTAAPASGGAGGGGLCLVTEWSVGPASTVELCGPAFSQRAEAHAD